MNIIRLTTCSEAESVYAYKNTKRNIPNYVTIFFLTDNGPNTVLHPHIVAFMHIVWTVMYIASTMATHAHGGAHY